MVKFGLLILPDEPVERLLQLAKLAEKHGFHYVWVGDENPASGFRDTFSMLTLIAANTRNIQIGTAICNPYTRHPALIATSALTLDELSGGRMNVGLGAGGSMALLPVGIPMWKHPVASVTESIQLLRKIFSGETVNFEGKNFRTFGIRSFASPAKMIPIYLGAKGPRLLAVAGRLADGAVISTVPLEHLERAKRTVNEAAVMSGRSSQAVEIAYITKISLSQNQTEAKQLIRKYLTFSVVDCSPKLLNRTKMSEEDQAKVKDFLKKGDFESASRMVTDEFIERFSMAGSAGDCLSKIHERLRAGARQIIFGPPYGPSPERSIQTLGQDVLPQVQATESSE